MVSLGIDIGGTGCKCVAFHKDGTQLAIAYLEYPNPPGKVNLDSLILRDAVLKVVGQCIQQLPNPKAVVAITVSSFGESFVPVDESGAPLTDIILYFANSESTAFDDLVTEIGSEKMMEITRILPDASYSLAKMLPVKDKAHKFLFVASYIAWVLSGKAVCDVSLACRSLLYDVKKNDWSAELLDAAGISENQLPTVLTTGGIAGTLLPEMAQTLGLTEEVKVVIGSHDQIVNALGAGVCAAGEAVDTSGTCECITPLFSQMPGLDFVKDNFACVPYLQDSGFVTYAYNISGGSAVRWYRDALALHLRSQAKEENCSIYDILNDQCPAEPTKLLILPYVQGMGGTPDVCTSATATFAGVTASTTLPEIYRGLLEGLCYEMAYNLEKLQNAGIRPDKLFACGGGARSKIWLQIKADVWGIPIIPVQTEETGALGSAILGFAAATGEQDVLKLAKDFIRHGEPILPNMEHHAYYQKQYAQYKKMRRFFLEEMY